mgnify:CR=1 FL=1
MLQVATNNSNIKASKEQNKKLKGNLGGSNMKLQLALDDITLEDAVELLDKVHPYVDIIEVGSPFIIEEGMRPVRIFKEKYPDCEILADTKIMDAGEYEAEETFKAGADYCTVLGVTDTLTIEGCVKAAKEYGKQTMVDMICVEDVPKRVKEIEAVGVDFIGVHVGVDQQAAGGINLKTIEEYKKLNPEVIIVGGGINHAKDPVAAAKAIYEAINQ